MINHLSRRWRILSCGGLLLLQLCGCARWIELTPGPISTVLPPHAIAEQEQVPLILDLVRVTRNGAPQSPSAEAERRLLASLSDIGLFARLEPTPSSERSLNTKIIRAHALVDEALDPHPGEAAWKGFVIGASMFLLTPLLPLEYDYAVHLTLELERWDGEIKEYQSQSAGTARYHLFGATPLVLDELKGHVTESCLTALMQQVVDDTPFYFASSAPLPDNRIHSVSVKSRRPEPSGIPLIPISSVSTK